MNLELIANAIRTEHSLLIRRTSLSGLYLENGSGATLAASLRRTATTSAPEVARTAGW